MRLITNQAFKKLKTRVQVRKKKNSFECLVALVSIYTIKISVFQASRMIGYSIAASFKGSQMGHPQCKTIKSRRRFLFLIS
jgi:hypothetical protein